jgi:twinkle protein
MTQINHIPCPDTDNCGSSDAYSWNDDMQVGWCHSCASTFFDQYKPLKRKTNMSTVVQYEHKADPDYKYVAMRGISRNTMEFFDVRTYTNSEDEPTRQEYLYPSGGVKIRYMPTKSFSARGLSSDELFGMNLWNAGCARTVTITEGELDALSVHQMLLGNYTNPVVSLPSATPSKRLWENCRVWLNSFEKIILSIDSDEAGDAVAAKIANMFPNKVYRVIHDKYKDANDFLVNGAGAQFKSAWFNAKKFVPENILNTTDQFMSLYKDAPEHQYVETGIVGLDDKILGLMQGHFTVIKAQTGIGKTEIMRYLEYNMLKKGVPIAAWHLEETKLRTLLGLVSYEAKDNLTRRDLIEAKGANATVEKAIHELTKDENFYQFYLADGQGTEELIDQIRFFREACGVRYVFFEPIQDVVAGKNEASKEETLADLSVRLSKLAAELNVGIVTIAHTNENGDPKYCKMIAQRASVIIDLQRDKESDDYEECNTTHLTVQKNRPCSEEGRAGKMRFSPETFTLREIM